MKNDLAKPSAARRAPPQRDYSPLDRLLIVLQRAGPPARVAQKVPYPAAGIDEPPLDEPSRRLAAGLMRVNHAGEVSAQALYHGQALLARDPQVRAHLLRSADEEQQHLLWCRERLRELGDGPSALDPLWYAGSFAMGAVAGLAGDRWNLGFVEETERQVATHLDEHLGRLPQSDARSRAILRAMKDDETRHGAEAAEAGARPLPRPLRRLMGLVSQVMKFGAYRV